MDQVTQSSLNEGRTYTQYGAVCWRMHRGRVEVLLVTSRDTGRWIIPKGWPMKGVMAKDAAAREAWEEAGVEGKVDGAFIGDYSYTKVRMRKCDRFCVVQVFPLRVARLVDKFPEKKHRRRKWFLASDAARLVNEPELREILQKIDQDPSLLDCNKSKTCIPPKSE